MEKEMRISHVMDLLAETGLSPEDLGERIGVSGMTIRRWMRRPGNEVLSTLYEEATRGAIYRLVVDGRLKPDSSSAQWAFKTAEAISQKARLVACGFPLSTDTSTWNEEEILTALEGLGENEENRAYVNSQLSTVESRRSLGEGWNDSISTSLNVIAKPSAPARIKSMAYGALCYLLVPIDLIPDTIPMVGLLDDFSILAMMSAYCRRALGIGG